MTAMQILAEKESENFYFKRPNYLCHGDCLISGFKPSDVTRREISVCENLKFHSHPNICGYHGVTVNKNGLVSSLVFDRFDMSLRDYVDQGHRFDAHKVLFDIGAGIFHLHRLGFVHCDIKPDNIFVKVREQRFVVGDFDSTHYWGDPIDLKWGTSGWTDDRFRTAEPGLDIHGLCMIQYWLENKGFGAPQNNIAYPPTFRILQMAKYPAGYEANKPLLANNNDILIPVTHFE